MLISKWSARTEADRCTNADCYSVRQHSSKRHVAGLCLFAFRFEFTVRQTVQPVKTVKKGRGFVIFKKLVKLGQTP